MIDVENVIKTLQAISDGHKVQACDGFIIVENPDATPERIALSGVDLNLVVELESLFYTLRNSKLIKIEKL